jgi:tetratricopeptide (TPR) repeat protein
MAISLSMLLLLAAPALADAQDQGAPPQDENAPAQDRGAPANPPAAEKTSPCLKGRALRSLGRYAEAEKAFTAALDAPKTVGCGLAGLKSLEGEVRGCAVGRALERAGQDEEAITSYQEALKANPSAACAQVGLERLNEEEPDFFADAESVKDDIQTAIELVVLALAGVFLACVLIGLLSWLPILRRLPPLSRLRKTRLSIEKFDDEAISSPAKIGPGLTALVRGHLALNPQFARGMSIVDGQAAQEDSVLSKFGEINDQAKVTAALLKTVAWFYPRRTFTANGVIQPKGDAGFGITASLRKGTSFADSTTFWASDIGVGSLSEIEQIRQLAVPAAAWIGHRLTLASGETAQGARDSISWALFKAGVELQKQGDEMGARELYRQALGLDARNWGAQANLGILELDDPDDSSGVARLKRAAKALEHE